MIGGAVLAVSTICAVAFIVMVARSGVGRPVMHQTRTPPQPPEH